MLVTSLSIYQISHNLLWSSKTPQDLETDFDFPLSSLWSNILSVKSFISLIEYFYNVVYSDFYLIKISKYLTTYRHVVGCVIPWMTSEDKKPITKHSLYLWKIFKSLVLI